MRGREKEGAKEGGIEVLEGESREMGHENQSEVHEKV